MRSVSRHTDKLSECLAAIMSSDHCQQVSIGVPTMFAGQQSLAIQLVCT